jgi:hypothetical protein
MAAPRNRLTPTGASLLALAALALPVAAADPTPPKPKADPLDWPPGTIILISDKPADALQRPDLIVLSADEYRKLRERIEQLSKAATPEKPELPSECHVGGSAETRGGQEAARLTAVFSFRAAPPKTRFALGLRDAKVAAATADDKGGFTLLLPRGDEGYGVQFDGPGPHRLTLEVEVPVTARGKGAERGFSLDLPGAAITTVDRFAAPAGVKKVTAGGRQWPAEALANPPAGLPALQPLGPAALLEVSWELPAAAGVAAGPPALGADARVTVRVEDSVIESKAVISVRPVGGGPASEWMLYLPPGADKPFAELVGTTTRPDAPAGEALIVEAIDARKGTWRVRAKEPTSQEVRVEVVSRQARPQPPPSKPADPKALDAARGPFSIGPFAVAGAFRQRGTVAIFAPPHLRPRYTPRGDVRREPAAGDNALADAVFGYGSLPVGPDKVPPPLLDMEVESVAGSVQSQLAHTLTLTESGWRLETAITVRAIRAELEHLDVEVPPVLQDVRVGPAGEVDGEPAVVRDGPNGWRLLRVRLVPGRPRPVRLTLEGLSAQPPGPGEAALLLPRLHGTQDRDGRVTATAPDGWELVGSAREWERDRVGEWEYGLTPPTADKGTPATNSLALSSRRTLARVDLAWRPFRPELAVSAVADVTLGTRQADVRVIWRLSGPGATAETALAGPAGLRCLDGGTLRPDGASSWRLVPAPAGDGAVIVTLAYAVPLPDPAGGPTSVSLPLPWPAAARGDTRIRFWAASDGSGWRPVRATAGPWAERPTEVIADRDTLPSLVLAAGGADLPLAVELAPAGDSVGSRAVLERGLVQAWLGEAGQQVFRARYLLRRSSGAAVDLELPAPVSALGLDVFVDGRRAEPVPLDGGRSVRVPVPASSGGGLLVEARCQLPAADRPASGGWPGEVLFAAPRPVGVVPAGPVRWQIGLAGSPVPLYLDDEAVAEQRWVWQRGLFLPAAARGTADLERWFAAGIEVPADEAGAAPFAGEAALVLRQPSAGPVRLVLLGRPLWLLACSLAVLAAGLLLALCGPGRLRFWALATVLTAVVVPAAVAWPQAAAQALAGAQPGLAVLAVVLLGQSLWAWYVRRRVRVLRGFSRSRTGSSLVRPSSQQRRREPEPAGGL